MDWPFTVLVSAVELNDASGNKSFLTKYASVEKNKFGLPEYAKLILRPLSIANKKICVRNLFINE